MESDLMEKMQEQFKEQLKVMQMAMLTQMQSWQTTEPLHKFDDKQHEEAALSDAEEEEMHHYLRQEALRKAETEAKEQEAALEAEMGRLQQEARRREEALRVQLEALSNQAQTMKQEVLKSKTNQDHLDGIVAEKSKGAEALR